MGVDDTGDLGLQRGAATTTAGFMDSHFSGLYPDHASVPMSSVLASRAAAPEQFVVAEWDPHADFGGALSLPAFDSGLMPTQGVHCSGVAAAEPIPTIPCFTGGGFPHPVAPFCAQRQVDIPRDYDREVARDANGKKRKNVSACDASSSSSSLNRTRNADSEQLKGAPSPRSLKRDEKRQRGEQNPGDSAGKSIAKRGNEQGKNAADGKEDYIHVRAKRGQATNSHSLAERVRREKISERMRFLQNLVPGCNKITGKAVMLDEIINYVQSLQRQVEFLSMKLATVSPELNFDIMRLLTKDMLHAGGGCSAAVGFEPGMNYSICYSSGFVPQPTIQPEILPRRASNPQEMMRNNVCHVSPIPQASAWDDGLHNATQMAFAPHMPAGNGDTEPPGNQE